jgi:arylsulfatase A-like enzyme
MLSTLPARVAALFVFAAPAIFAAALQPPNVVLITVDTLRADHLSCYGYAWATSPNIDQLAREGTRFERAYTMIPLTGPAHLALFTSLYPQELGVRRNGVAIPGDRHLKSLPQILRGKGYRAAAFVSGWPLTDRLTHLGRWFDHFDEDLNRSYQLFNSSRWAEDVTPRAIQWLQQHMGKGKPVFLWVHYFDPHSPYDLRSGFESLRRAPAGLPVHIADEDMRERVRNYDTEIAYMDWHLGKLMRTVRELGHGRSTLTILTADHGESLGEHDYVGHGRELFENIVQVPLIFHMPGHIRAGQAISTPVSLLDIAPTIAGLTLPKPPERVRFSGRTLEQALTTGEPLPEVPVYYATFPGKKGVMPNWFSWLWVSDEQLPSQFGYLESGRKVIWSPDDRKLAIYDMARDPREMHPRRISDGNQTYAANTTRLESWFKSTESRAGQETASQRDLDVLKTLGYTQ